MFVNALRINMLIYKLLQVLTFITFVVRAKKNVLFVLS